MKKPLFRKFLVFGGLLAVAVLLWFFHWQWNLQTLLSLLQKAPPTYLVVTLLIAPLVGVPLSPLLMCLGVVLPFWSALCVATLVIFLHHLIVLAAGQTPMADWLAAKLRGRGLLPASRQQRSFGDNALFIFTTTWIPGISYIFKPVFLLLSGINIRLYLGLATASQVIAALPYLTLGRMTGDGHFFWMGVCLFVIFALAWLIKTRLLARNATIKKRIKE